MAHRLNPLWQLLRRRTRRGHWATTAWGLRYWDTALFRADAWFPWGRRWFVGRDLEEAPYRALSRLVRPGDRVTIVGGGCGITAVAALRSSAGEVRVIEPADLHLDAVKRTLDLNFPGGAWTIVPGYVGELRVETGRILGNRVEPDEVLACDVLEMDCEGGELDFLRSIRAWAPAWPDRLLVETHGYLGSATADVEAELHRLGFAVETIGGFPETDCMNLLATRGGQGRPDGLG